MFGHWESQTRKLNRHYQSVRRLGFWNAIKGNSKLKYSALHKYSNSKLKYAAVKTQQEDDKMVYKITKEIVLDTEWIDKDIKIGAYNHDPVIIAGTQDTAMKGLSDKGKPLAGGANRFLGWQVTAFGVNPEISDEDVDKYARISGDGNDIGLFPTEPGTNLERAIQEDISVAPNGSDTANFLSLYNIGKNITKHNITQLNNIDFVGNNDAGQFFNAGLRNDYQPSMTIARNGLTDLGATVTLGQAVPDDVFMNTDNKDIPIIGATVCLTNWGYNRPRVVYILTPTVVDAEGNIVELTH